MNARSECSIHASQRNVTMLIDERVDPLGAGHVNEVRGRSLVGVVPLRRSRAIGSRAVAGGFGGDEADDVAVATAAVGPEDAGGGARHADAGQRAVGHEPDEATIPARGAGDMEVQVEERIPAAGDGEAVARDRLGHAAVERRDAHGGEHAVGVAVGADHRRVVADLDAELAGALDQRALRVLAHVNDHLHRHTGTREVDRRAVGVIVGREHDELLRHEAEAMKEAADAGSEHDARSVVVGEDQRALGGTGRDDELVRADLPHTTHGAAAALLLGQVLRDALHQRHGALIAIVEGGRAGEDRHVGVGAQARLDVGHPVRSRLVVDQLFATEQCATEVRMIINEDHTRAGIGRSQRGAEAGRTGTDDEDVAVSKALLEPRVLALGR